MDEKYQPIGDLASVVQLAEAWRFTRRQLDYAVDQTGITPVEQRGLTKLYDPAGQRILGQFMLSRDKNPGRQSIRNRISQAQDRLREIDRRKQADMRQNLDACMEAIVSLQRHVEGVPELAQRIVELEAIIRNWLEGEQQRAEVLESVQLGLQSLTNNLAILGTDLIKRLVALEGGEVPLDDLHEAQHRDNNFVQNIESQIDAQMTKLFEESE